MPELDDDIDALFKLPLTEFASTLEALSVATSLSERTTPGRLTEDTDPPGFDSLGSFTPSAPVTSRAAKPLPVTPAKKAVTASSKAQKASAEASRQKERQTRINS